MNMGAGRFVLENQQGEVVRTFALESDELDLRDLPARRSSRGSLGQPTSKPSTIKDVDYEHSLKQNQLRLGQVKRSISFEQRRPPAFCPRN